MNAQRYEQFFGVLRAYAARVLDDEGLAEAAVPALFDLINRDEPPVAVLRFRVAFLSPADVHEAVEAALFSRMAA